MPRKEQRILQDISNLENSLGAFQYGIVCQNWPKTYEYSMTFHSVFMNLRKKCALDSCTITNLNEINQNSPIGLWIMECDFSTQKMWVRAQ